MFKDISVMFSFFETKNQLEYIQIKKISTNKFFFCFIQTTALKDFKNYKQTIFLFVLYNLLILINFNEFINLSLKGF